MVAEAAVGVVVEGGDFEDDGPVDCSDGGSVDAAGVKVVALLEACYFEGLDVGAGEEEPEVLEIVGAVGDLGFEGCG